MLTVSHSQLIPHPIEHVFEAASEPQAQLAWDTDVTSIEILGGGPLGQGSRIRSHFPQIGTVESERLEHEPPHHFTSYSDIPRWENWHRFDFEAVTGGTVLTQRSSFKLRGLWVLAAPLIRLMIGRRLRQMADALTRYLDSHAAS